ncbi:helix-turn-helix domain-containing protein [uncultured Nitratireductor sp.]|uniref:helix-turn-helix domain-containing protein n=1 Tax=uncultured Nitratireductor sp. TaxID=520953 RepID=UPI0025FD1F1C|nr:helix-turn-helix domain-containing protein [uncultured Nitratireductor sp.]
MSGRCPCCGGMMPPGAVPREEIVGRLETTSQVFRDAVRRLAWRPGHQLTSYELAEYIWKDDPNGGPDTADAVVRVTIRRERHHLEPLGWRIERRAGHGGGYRLILAASDA